MLRQYTLYDVHGNESELGKFLFKSIALSIQFLGPKSIENPHALQLQKSECAPDIATFCATFCNSYFINGG